MKTHTEPTKPKACHTLFKDKEVLSLRLQQTTWKYQSRTPSHERSPAKKLGMERGTYKALAQEGGSRHSLFPPRLHSSGPGHPKGPASPLQRWNNVLTWRGPQTPLETRAPSLAGCGDPQSS